MTWAEVDQAAFRTKAAKAPSVTLSLAPMRGSTYLWFSISKPLLNECGWAPDQKISLWVGEGKLGGWLKFAPAAIGRSLKRIGRATEFVTVALVPPMTWRDLACARTTCEMWRIQGNALLVEIPWDFSEISDATLAEVEAAA